MEICNFIFLILTIWLISNAIIIGYYLFSAFIRMYKSTESYVHYIDTHPEMEIISGINWIVLILFWIFYFITKS